jgi:LCP family protein required for cell wall assembly
MTILDKEEPSSKNTKKRKKKKSVKHILFYKILSFILIIITLVMLGIIIVNDILPINYVIYLCILSFIVVFIISFILNRRKLRNWIKNIFSIISILIMIIELLFLFYGSSTLKFLSNVTDTGYRVESFGIYVLKTSNISNIKDLDGKDVYYLDHDDDTSIREAVSKLEKKVSVDIDYKDDIEELLVSLNNNECSAILVDTSYEELINEEFSDYDIKLIYTIDIVSSIDTIQSDVDITKDPFIIYISGIDTKGNVQSKARSDVNILLVVNPKTKKVLMVNTPRDYYITLHSKQKKDKLTHAGIYGVEESLHTLEDLYDVNIDYYVRINFTSFVKIVDAIGGIKVNVPISFCEQDSNRSSSSSDLVCLDKGYQSLNGEQALALARHRHTLPTGDVGRGENQMLILEAIINKSLSSSILSKYDKIISALEGRVSTNMTTKEMVKFASKQKGQNNTWTFSTLNASGTNSTNVCYSSGSSKAYVMEPDTESVSEISNAIKELLSTKNS